MLVFRPFVGEILAGKVSSCTKQGIKVGLRVCVLCCSHYGSWCLQGCDLEVALPLVL